MAQPLRHAKRAHGLLKDWTPVIAAVTTILGAAVMAVEGRQDTTTQVDAKGFSIVYRRPSILAGLRHYVGTLLKILLGFVLVSVIVLVWLKSDPAGQAVESTLLICLSLGLAFARER